MAVEMERGFSIRGHVAKMRTVDAAKCQLFDGESLPPMDVRTFRWWSDVAAAQPQTSKQKTSKKKKRSILEIFKVAPQITAVDGQSDGGELERTEVTGGEGLYYADLASVGKREGLENKLLGNNCRVRVEKKKKKVKNKVNKGKLQIKKGKIQTKNVKENKKHKDDTTTSSISISQLIQEIKRKKMLKKSLNLSTDPQKINKKNKKIPSILSEKENSLKLSPKSTTPKPQIKNCSVQSILKKQIKTSPFKKKVTFCEKDDILGNKNSSSLVINETNNIINETLRDIQNEISPLSNTPDLNQIIDCSDNNCIEIRAEDVSGEITKEPSNSCLINLLEGPIDTTNKDVISNNKDLISNNKDVISVSSSTGSNKSMSVETRLNNDCMSNNICFDEDYIGLPLNSQGELTINPNFNPNPNPVSGELFYRQDYQVEHNLCPRPVNIMPKISSNNNNNINHAIIQTSPLYYKDKFGAEHYYAPLMPVKPGFGFANIPGFERMEILPNGPSSFYQLETNNIEPTVRLMGKNVSLGKNNISLNNNSIIGDVHFASKNNNNNNNSINGDVHFSSKNNNNNLINGDVHFSSKNNNNNNSINEDVHFASKNNIYNSRNGDVHFASKNNNNNSINGDVQLSNRYVNPITRYCEYNRQMPAQQILLNSTHCKQSQSQHLSFASSSGTSLPQWILNPKSITHKPAFPSYTNPNNHNYNYNYNNNNNNMSPNYSPTYPHYVSSRPKLNFIKPPNHLNNNPHNKRPRLETGLDLIPNPAWQMGGFNNQAVKAQTANTDPGESKLRSGPVKLSAGARHLLKPGTDVGPVNSKPVYCTVPLTCGTRTSQKSSEIYRF